MSSRRFPSPVPPLALAASFAFGVRPFSDAVLNGRLSGFVSASIFLLWTLGALVVTVEFMAALLRDASIRRKLRLSLATVGLLLVATELFLRLGLGRYSSWLEDNDRNYRSAWINPQPERKWLHLGPKNESRTARKPEWTFEASFNSEGIRDREYPLEKRPSEFRIVAFGDSFTQGVGVHEDGAWPRKTETALRAALPARDLTVINAGVSGSDPIYSYLHLNRRMLEYRPDLVVLAVNRSDLHDVTVRGGMERFQPDGRIVHRSGPWWEWAYASSYIVRHTVHDLLKYNRLLLSARAQKGETERAQEDIYSTILRFKEAARERGSRFLVVFHPVGREVERGAYTMAPVVDRLRNESSIHLLDVLDCFLNQVDVTSSNWSQFYWPIDKHHNARGYAKLAECLTEYLLRTDFAATRP